VYSATIRAGEGVRHPRRRYKKVSLLKIAIGDVQSRYGSVRSVIEVAQSRRDPPVLCALSGDDRWAQHVGKLGHSSRLCDRRIPPCDDRKPGGDQASNTAAISPKLEQAEIERIKHKPTESLDAYDYFLQGMADIHELTKESINRALQLLYRAIHLDPDFASAYGMATWCYVQRKANGWMTDRSQEIDETSRLARRAVSLGKQDAVALSRAGHALSYVVCDVDSGAIFVERALTLNPNLAFAWFASGWTNLLLGEPEKVLRDFAHVMRLSPLDPLMPTIRASMALGHFIAGQHDEASLLADRALREKPGLHIALRAAAASNALRRAR
jgi:tetratricopeptide (TPR) repeat protein